MSLKRSVPVNNSPSWVWCLHSVGSVSSGAPPWRLMVEGTVRESVSPSEKLLIWWQLDISRTPRCLMEGRTDGWMKDGTDEQLDGSERAPE